MSINFEDALKAKKLRNFFHEHGRVFIIVDATRDEVMVPDILKGDPALPLVLNARMPQPIYIRDSFLESNFSFSGVSYHCVVPMGCIWATYLPESDLSSGIVWDKSMPEVVRMVMNQEAQAAEDAVVLKSAPDSAENKKEKSEKAPGERKVDHLRVIK